MPMDHEIHLENGHLAADSPTDHVSRLVRRALDEAGAGGIVLHFHGGLVSLPEGRAIAKRLTPFYCKSHAFPIFFVWESGLLETLGNNLGELVPSSGNRTSLHQRWPRPGGLVAEP